MSTDKSLKHLKSKDKFLLANVSNPFEKHSGQDSSSCVQQTVQPTGVSRRTVFLVRETGTLGRRNVQNGDNTNLWTTLMRLQSETMCRRHQLPTINNLLSVMNTDIMPTIHQN